jgi:(E)-4-hydroxy-3-methylbut-2-enyl-diphosphate synthase
MKNIGFISRIVQIGEVPLGGKNPVRIQSMTSTNTLDTGATVSQAIRMIEAGCEYVRLTAQGIKEAGHLAVIKKELKRAGFTTPLIADIHYNPVAAEVAARLVEKVRINPGNYVDRKKGRLAYSTSEYFQEIEKIRERIKPLIKICKQYGTALRIGSNHGSLSERILLRYGDTPAGMVESALEFVRICEDLDFRDIVLSMKASNVKVMVQANRLLVKKMTDEGKNYPVHLGVTEAGDAWDGRMKSAAGIGTLLEEGIGDTIRVSLTEDPEFEIPVAKAIASRFNDGAKRRIFTIPENKAGDPFSYSRRLTAGYDKIGNEQVPVIVCDAPVSNIFPDNLSQDFLPDYIFRPDKEAIHSVSMENGKLMISAKGIKPLIADSFEELVKIPQLNPGNFLIIKTNSGQKIHEVRRMINFLFENKIRIPVILQRNFFNMPENEVILQAACDFSFLLVDGLIDGILITHQNLNVQTINNIAFGILQAAGSRISRTEYVACPSCGRTLFGIQETLKKIKTQTSHLKGLKIGVMGCCVNGPGEMADADYGYVGAGRGKITLYRRKQIVQAGIPENEAVEALIDLIKVNGDWK